MPHVLVYLEETRHRQPAMRLIKSTMLVPTEWQHQLEERCIYMKPRGESLLLGAPPPPCTDQALCCDPHINQWFDGAPLCPDAG